MFGDPEPLVTKTFGMLNEIETLAQGFARCFTDNDRHKVENGNWNHAFYSERTIGFRKGQKGNCNALGGSEADRRSFQLNSSASTLPANVRPSCASLT